MKAVKISLSIIYFLSLSLGCSLMPKSNKQNNVIHLDAQEITQLTFVIRSDTIARLDNSNEINSICSLFNRTKFSVAKEEFKGFNFLYVLKSDSIVERIEFNGNYVRKNNRKYVAEKDIDSLIMRYLE